MMVQDQQYLVYTVLHSKADIHLYFNVGKTFKNTEVKSL